MPLDPSEIVQLINRTPARAGRDVSFVSVSADEFDGWLETLYLLSSPENAKRMARSLAEARTAIDGRR